MMVSLHYPLRMIPLCFNAFSLKDADFPFMITHKYIRFRIRRAAHPA